MILQLYDQLLAIEPSPVVQRNRVVALAMAHGVAAAIPEAEGLEPDLLLQSYPHLSATLAELYRRLPPLLGEGRS